MPPFNPLLNPPLYPAERFAPLADRLQRLLATRFDVIFVQAEAILALEAAATSLARPGLRAINIVTSPYGGYFGGWLERGGATLREIVAAPGQPIAVAAIAAALEENPDVDLIAVVHAETSSGILNPLPEIAAIARRHGALLVVDAVASAGGHPLEIDALGIDVCVVGPQKALGGPTSLSAVAVSPRAWAAMAPATPSSLSLPEIRRTWLDTGRGALPGMPSPLEFWALEAALDRVEAEGLTNLIARHQLAARASRAGLVALGPGPWVADAAAASALVTAAPVPAGIDAEVLIAAAAGFGVTFVHGFGAAHGRLVRLDHTGARAGFAAVLANIGAYGAALAGLGARVDIAAAAAAVAATYAARR